ncbi:MAG: redox-regulated ATPase YchF [Candidatus Rokubacteria bacterium]|nr:redox-regulated ATPase YchF [Candidatus Rokubacteria bacterium]
MKLGIIGFPRSGKTTLFSLLTGADAAVSRKGLQGELHVGVARVPDERLARLAALARRERIVFASVEVVDLAGFERGQRAGLDVGDLRNADALLHVVRAFPSPSLGAPPDTRREATALEEELILADLEVLERRLAKLGPGLKRKATEAEQREQALLRRLQEPLEAGTPLRAQALPPDETRALRGFGFLSLKPILHCLNLAEADVGRRHELLAALAGTARQPASMVGWVSAVLEGEVAALPPGEQKSFLEALGLPEPALHRVIRDAYTLLGLVSFFTIGDEEVRAWTIPAGATALEAAAAVHSDMARGFIRAEVIGWAELLEAGSLAEARRRGLLRLEGKEYPVEDGEVCQFRFHVGR